MATSGCPVGNSTGPLRPAQGGWPCGRPGSVGRPSGPVRAERRKHAPPANASGGTPVTEPENRPIIEHARVSRRGLQMFGVLAAALGLLLAMPAKAEDEATDTIIPDGIIHDAEFQRLWKQNGEKWLAEDAEIANQLADLEKKFGKKPNIIHILWDDMRYGAVGHRLLTDISGYEAPNIEKMAAGGPLVHAHVHRAVLHAHARGSGHRSARGPLWDDLPDLSDPPDGAAGLGGDDRRGRGRHVPHGLLREGPLRRTRRRATSRTRAGTRRSSASTTSSPGRRSTRRRREPGVLGRLLPRTATTRSYFLDETFRPPRLDVDRRGHRGG